MSPSELRDTDVATLERWFAAYNAHDVDALCEIADPSVEVIPLTGESVPPGTSYYGREGVRTLMTAGFERFPNMRLRHSPPRPTGAGLTSDLEFVMDDGAESPQVRTARCEYRLTDGRIRSIRAVDPEQPSETTRAELLSPRERQVLALLATGDTVGEIALALVLSPLTVRTHVRNAKDKLRARTTAHAVAIALDEDVLER